MIKYMHMLYYFLLGIHVDAKQWKQSRESFGLPLNEYFNSVEHSPSLDPEWNMTTVEIIRYHGYPVEEHDVITSDGYILTIHRIPHGKKLYSGKKKNPIIIQHGLMATSSSFILNPPHQNMPYKLADAGYDIWLTNIRGNTYGMRHLTLSPNDDNFWRFSLDEVAVFDIPAIIDYVIATTKSKQVYLIGHSMGTTVPAITLATLPQYNKKISLAVFISPIIAPKYTIMSHENFFHAIMAPYLWVLEGKPMLPNSITFRRGLNNICDTPFRQLCKIGVTKLIMGLNHGQHNMSRLPVYFGHYPDSTSVQLVLHYFQMLTTRAFRKYDFGRKNYRIYGKFSPPDYELSNITAPIIIFWSDFDVITNPIEVAHVRKILPAVIDDYRIPDDRFSHVDYELATSNGRLVHDKLLELFENHANY